MRGRTILVFVMLSGLARAEIIDRIAVTVGNQVVTESELIREIRLTAFLNGGPLDFSPEARRKAAERLIEQKLIRKEIQLGSYPAPQPEETGPAWNEIQARFPSAVECRQALARYGITEPDLKAHLVWQLGLLRFIDLRFRPGVQVSEDDIRKYFDQALPALEKKAGPATKLTFEDWRDQIARTLTDERIDRQMDEWLRETRKRTRIEYRREVLP